MKNRAVNKDFNKDNLPSSRKEQFKYIIKNRYLTLMSAGGSILLFSLPLLIAIVFKYLFLKPINVSLLEEGADIGLLLFQARNIALLFDAIYIICVAILFIGLAGVSKVIKSIIFDEFLSYKDEFRQGVKDNAKHYVLMSLFVSIMFLIFEFILYSSKIIDSKTMFIFAIVLIGIFVFTIFPTVCMSLPFISVYTNKFKDHFKSSSLIVLGKYFPYVGISSIFFILLAIMYVLLNVLSSIIAPIAIIGLIILYLLPILIIGNHLYCFYVFDENFNKDNKNIYHKGLKDYLKENDL